MKKIFALSLCLLGILQFSFGQESESEIKNVKQIINFNLEKVTEAKRLFPKEFRDVEFEFSSEGDFEKMNYPRFDYFINGKRYESDQLYGFTFKKNDFFTLRMRLDEKTVFNYKEVSIYFVYQNEENEMVHIPLLLRSKE